MYVVITSMFLTISTALALIIKGIVERGFWIISTVLFLLLYNKSKRERSRNLFKRNCKDIAKGVVLGYSVVLLLLIYMQHPLKETYAGFNYVDTGKTAIVMVYRGEPDTYKLSLAIRNHMIKNKLWQNIFLPFELFREKLYYEKSGVTKGNNFSIRLEQQIKTELGESIYLSNAYLFNEPYLSESINRAILEGNKRIILCPVFLTEKNEVMLMENIIRTMNLQESGIQIKKTQTLWNSDIIARSFISQVNNYKESRHKHNVGILLIGGELQKDQYHATFQKQDLLFREKVKDYLIRDGYSTNKIKLSFFEKENIKKEIEGLMEYGVSEVLLVLVSDDLLLNHYQLEIKKTIRNIDRPYAVNIYSIDPWSLNDDIKQELINRIRLLNLQN